MATEPPPTAQEFLQPRSPALRSLSKAEERTLATRAKAAKYNDLLALAIAKHADPEKLVKGLVEMATGATSSKAVGKGEDFQVIEEPDYATRLRATRLIMEYGAGKPTERKELVISEKSDADEFEARIAHPQHREFLLAHLERKQAEIIANQAKEARGETLDAEIIPPANRPAPDGRKLPQV